MKGLREDMFRAVAAHARAPLRVRALATRNGVAARWAELADPSAIALWNRLKNCRGLAACSMRGVVPVAGGVCGLRSQIPNVGIRSGRNALGDAERED